MTDIIAPPQAKRRAVQRINKHYFQGTMKWPCLSANCDTVRVVKVQQTSFSPSGIVLPAGLLECAVISTECVDRLTDPTNRCSHDGV
jgi:hypothetical protein